MIILFVVIILQEKIFFNIETVFYCAIIEIYDEYDCGFQLFKL